jgi:hypothetical protein
LTTGTGTDEAPVGVVARRALQEGKMATYNVTVKCFNCFWKGTIALTKGLCVTVGPNGIIAGALCGNCNCELLVKDDR